MDRNKLASDLVKLAKELISSDKPKEGDLVSMLKGRENFFYIEKPVRKRGNKWLVEDESGEEHWVERDDDNDSSNKKAWKEVKASVNKQAANILDDIATAVEQAKSFMDIGKQLKAAGIKYEFTTSPLSIYIVKKGSDKYGIVNKKYADDAERIVGKFAIGKF